MWTINQSLTELLDKLCSPESQIHLESFFAKFPDVEGIRKDKFQEKTLKKLVARLVKLYHIPNESVPVLTQSRSEGALRYLFYKRYTEGITHKLDEQLVKHEVSEFSMEWNSNVELSRSIHDSNWEDMILESVRACPGMEKYVLRLFLTQGDLAEGTQWALRLKVPTQDIPGPIQDHLQENPTLTHNLPEENGAEEKFSVDVETYMKLPFDLEDVQLVDTKEKLDSFYGFLDRESAASNGALLVGLDSEWRPTFGTSKEKVAVLQVSTRSKAFLLDFIALGEVMSETDWNECFKILFCNEHLRKLGFQFDGDMVTLLSTVPTVKDQLQNVRNIVCLAVLVKKLRYQSLEIVSGLTEMIQSQTELSLLNSGSDPEPESPSSAPFPLNDEEDSDIVFSAEAETTCVSASENALFLENGTEELQTPPAIMETPFHFKLTDLCSFYLGKPLDKAEQFSNWARRPLRPPQIHYAALDAYCEIELYDKLKEKSKELGLDFEKACEQSFVGPPRDRTSMKGLGSLGGGGQKKSQARKWMERAELMEMIKAVNKNTATHAGERKRPGEVRVVCDKMVQGLGKHLRRVGVDSMILENQDTLERAVEYARKEHRIILSSGSAFLAVSNRVPKELCVCVPGSGKNGKEQLAWALQHFRIQVTEGDIFSRCMMCNCADYIFVPGPYMRVMWDAVVAPKNPFETEAFDRSSAERGLAEEAKNLQESDIRVEDMGRKSPKGLHTN